MNGEISRGWQSTLISRNKIKTNLRYWEARAGDIRGRDAIERGLNASGMQRHSVEHTAPELQHANVIGNYV